jgi:serine O-acetyltransferase
MSRPLGKCTQARALREAVRLAWESDAFLAQSLYRAKARLQALRVPVVPRVCHALAIAIGQVCIGDPVLVHPGVYLAHGQVVIDGIVEIHRGTVIFPFTTIGLRAGEMRGPTVGPGVTIGSGARVIGPIAIGEGARIGANAVVLEDVPTGATAVGNPARLASAKDD